MLRWLLIFVVIAAAAWWLASPDPSAPTVATAPTAATGSTTASRTIVACTPPARLAGDDGTVQSDAPGGMTPFALKNATATPLAGFSVAARVLARKEYGSDREADFAPLDLALGWNRMRDDAVLSQLDISQSGRFYRYRWSRDPPIPPDEIVRSSANMHLVPANDVIADALESVDTDERVRIDGWLVQIEATDGWRWRSSLTRDDSGAGACEVIYVCAVTVR
jgi:hypothetical protein